jgi:hypothetical protein
VGLVWVAAKWLEKYI